MKLISPRFHFGQAVWRHAEKEFGKTLKSSKCFADLVRRCLGLPFILTDELQEVVDQLKLTEMESETVNLCRDQFLEYIQNSWINGPFPPDTWSCFGRRSDMTNNACESYNSVLNRLVQIAHPNVVVLMEHFVLEINYSADTVGRIAAGKRGKAQKRTIYKQTEEETERLKHLYLQGQVVGDVLAYLKRIGFLHGRLVEEATRKKTASATSENIVVSEDNPAVSEDDPAVSEDDPAMSENDPATSEDDPARPDIISAPSAPATQSMASRPVRDRLLEIQALGLGERSFTNPNSPFLGRVIGTGSQVQARQDNAKNQVEYDLKGKKCLKCLKRFQNGVFKKSKVVKCNGCGGFVHEKNGSGCHVIRMHEDKIFYCNICAQHAKANQSIVPHITLHSTANQELGHNLDLILDDIEEILPAGPEEDERHLNMSMAADLEVIILFFLPLPLIFILLFRSSFSPLPPPCSPDGDFGWSRGRQTSC